MEPLYDTEDENAEQTNTESANIETVNTETVIHTHNVNLCQEPTPTFSDINSVIDTMSEYPDIYKHELTELFSRIGTLLKYDMSEKDTDKFVDDGSVTMFQDHEAVENDIDDISEDRDNEFYLDNIEEWENKYVFNKNKSCCVYKIHNKTRTMVWFCLQWFCVYFLTISTLTCFKKDMFLITNETFNKM